MSECKKQQIDDYNLRSEEVQEVMGGVPHWIMRWGISLIAIIMAMLVVASYFFHYPEKITTNVKLIVSPQPTFVMIPQSCTLQQVLIRNSDVVRKGQSLAIVSIMNKDSVLLSPAEGMVNFVSECTKGNKLAKNTTLFVIAPLRASCSSGVIYASANEAEKIVKGQCVIINNNKKIKGEIRSKSYYPDDKGRYIIDVVFPNIDIAQSSMFITNVKAEVIIKNKRIIENFLPSFNFTYKF